MNASGDILHPDPRLVERLNAARAAIERRVADAARAAGRDPSEITIVAVSKTHPVETVAAAYAAGFRHFGENYAAEFAAKAAALAGFDEIVWHYIGQLQTNKVKLVAGVASVIESVDRPSLVEAIAKRAPASTVFIQVNLSGERHRGGVAPEGVSELVAVARNAGLNVAGVMGVAPLGGEAETRAAFELLESIRAKEGLVECSMGMSGDLEAAVAAGSTMVRIGTAIFGAREDRAR